MDLTRIDSPNFNERKFPLDMLVLHYTGMQTLEDAAARLMDPKAKVSDTVNTNVSSRVVKRKNTDATKPDNLWANG